MDILLSGSSGVPIYRQITLQVKQMVLAGTLSEGEALPSMRQLAKDLRISVITTKRAYEELEQAGFIHTVAGKGCFIAAPDTRQIEEEHRMIAEEHLRKAARAARLGNITLDELRQMLEIFHEEDN